MNTTNDVPVWAGVAEVVPQNGNNSLGGARAAYVAIAALAESEGDFREVALSALGEMGFDMVELDDAEMIRNPNALTNADPEFVQKVKSLNKSVPFVYGSFHCYRESAQNGSE